MYSTSSSLSSSSLSVLACTLGNIWYHCSLCAEVTSKKLTSVTFIYFSLVMINKESNRNAFINNNMCNINSTNSLKHLLDDSEEKFDTISASTYSDDDSLADLMSSNNSNFSILSLNVQSINAKFDELKITIEQINQVHTISVICI